jgi:hypothetical protein
MNDIPKIRIAESIPGYIYGTNAVPRSPITLAELEHLKQSVRWTEEDEHYRHLAGEVLADQTAAMVTHWRNIIANYPHLAQYSLTQDGQAIPHYSHDSGLRFQQWIVDTCLRPYDQSWLDYQQEIALRHTSLKKNKTDNVQSAAFIPLRYVLAFAAVVNETTKPYLAAGGHSAQEVEKMYQAWCKSVLLQVTLWSQPYTSATLAPDEW